MVLHEPSTPDSVAAAKADLWWRENADRVRAYLVHQTDPTTAEDLLVEVFILAMRRHAIVPEPPIGWLIKTARHVVSNHRRGAKRYRSVVERVRASQDTRQVASSREATRADLDALLDGLSDTDREVLTMSAWYGLTASEAAEALDITVNNYGVKLHRARARFEQLRQAELRDGGGAP